MSVCSCPKHCPDRAEMRRRHGTPNAFETAIFVAIGDWISVTEVQAAIAKYRSEYDAADDPAAPCFACGKTYDEHREAVRGAPIARMMCLGLKTGFRPKDKR